jgi:hypothetical protein
MQSTTNLALTISSQITVIFQTSKFYFTYKTHESKYQQKFHQTPCITRTQKHNKTQQSYGVLQNLENWIMITHCFTYLKHQNVGISFTLKLVPDFFTPNYLNN